MSKIRSQLNSILATGKAGPQTQSARRTDPRRAQPAFPSNQTRSLEPDNGHWDEQPVRSPAPRSQPIRDTNSNTAAINQMSAIQQRLDQLTGKLGAMTNTAPQARPTNMETQPGQQAMLQEIRDGFRQVRHELSEARNSQSLDVGNDLQRISEGIALLQDSRNLHPDYIDQMHSELGNLQQGLEQLLSRQETRFDLSGVTQSIESGYSDIVTKLDMLLTGRGATESGVNAPDYSDKLEFMSSRIEEMSRAVISLAVSPDGQADQQNFERIEARIASLTKMVEDMQHADAPASIDLQHFERIDTHISNLAKSIEDMQQVGAPVSVDLSSINDRLDTLQNDIGILAGGLEQHLASGDGPANFAANQAGSESLAAVEQRLTSLADRLESLSGQPAENPNASGHEILSTLRELVEKVESLEARPAAPATDMDISALENQLSEIMQRLDASPAGASAQATDLTPLSERLDNIEGQIAASRDIVIDMATQAADKTSPGDAETGSTIMASILEELRELREMKEQLVPSTGAENEQLTEINRTMSALVSRLDQMEQGAFAPVGTQVHRSDNASILEQSPEPYLAEQDLPRTQDTFDSEAQMDQRFDEPALVGTGFENADHASHQAFHDAPSLDEYHNAPQSGQSTIEPEFHNEPEIDDVPLAPGSGMPDLEALVRRATQRKKEKPVDKSGETSNEDGNISELMAAARRAAQAASVVAQSEKTKPNGKKPKMPKVPSFSRPGFLSKKVLLMSAAVAAIAIGGLTLAPKITGIFGGTSAAPKISSATTAPAPATTEQAAVESDPAAGTVTEASQNTAQSALLSPKPVAEMANGKEETKTEAVSSPDLAQPVPEAAENTTVAASLTPPDEIGNQALLQAASAGQGDALFEIGRRYTEGEGVERSLETAVTWYEKSAETGYAPAQYRLGNFYEKGHGVAADPAKAAFWYEKAASKGNALAMHNLAVLNAMGLVGPEPDMNAAVAWFEKAADMGVKDSQVNLGILYTKGMGVTENLVLAYKWFAVAAKGGDTDAGKKRDTIAQAMRPEQLEKARGEAEIWKPVALEPLANIAAVKDEWKSGPTLQSTGLSQQEIIRQTQQLLTRAGFDAGPADGKMGERTKNAIILFQNKVGLPADGVISPALVQALSQQSI